MIPTERPLDNPINWSFRLGRIWDISIRIHITFLLGAVILVWMELPKPEDHVVWEGMDAVLNALGAYSLLFLVVLLHELGHCYGARMTGGEADEILLWPLGGLAYVRPPHHPGAHLAAATAGPLVNVALCGLSAGALAWWMQSLGAVPWNPWHPTLPIDPTLLPSTGQQWLLRFYGISYFLLIVNLLPIFPFDGGRILQAVLWKQMGYAASIELATGIGMIGAIGVGLLGLFHEQSWVLLGIAVFGYLTCHQTRRSVRERGEFGYSLGDESDGWMSAPPQRARRAGYFARRRARRAVLRAEAERKREELRVQMVEEILRKVSTQGIASLTPRDRKILEEETERRRRISGD